MVRSVIHNALHSSSSITYSCLRLRLHTNTDAHTQTHALKHTHAHAHKRMHTHTHSRTHDHTNERLPLTHALTDIRKHTHANTHISTNTHTHEQTHTLTHTHARTQRWPNVAPRATCGPERYFSGPRYSTWHNN